MFRSPHPRPRRQPGIRCGLTALFFLVSGFLCAQTTPSPDQAAVLPNLSRTEAVDAASGVHFVRLSLSLPVSTGSPQTTPPRFTVECQENKGKHDLLWFLTFGGVDDPGFVPPFRPSQTALFPPQRPSVKLKMSFEGYIKWKPMTEEWSVLSTGELRYRNPGSDSPNMESPRALMQYLYSLPGLRIGYAKPKKGDTGELFFQTKPLLDELKRSPTCSP